MKRVPGYLSWNCVSIDRAYSSKISSPAEAQPWNNSALSRDTLIQLLCVRVLSPPLQPFSENLPSLPKGLQLLNNPLPPLTKYHRGAPIPSPRPRLCCSSSSRSYPRGQDLHNPILESTQSLHRHSSQDGVSKPPNPDHHLYRDKCVDSWSLAKAFHTSSGCQ